MMPITNLVSDFGRLVDRFKYAELSMRFRLQQWV